MLMARGARAEGKLWLELVGRKEMKRGFLLPPTLPLSTCNPQGPTPTRAYKMCFHSCSEPMPWVLGAHFPHLGYCIFLDPLWSSGTPASLSLVKLWELQESLDIYW